MKIRKVYSSYFGVLVGFVSSYLMITTSFHPIDWILIIGGIFFALATLMSFYFSFFCPFFSYDDKNIFRGRVFRKDEKNDWADVVSIATNEYGWSTFILLQNGNVIPMNILVIRGYFRVLANIVDVLSSRNPKAKIDTSTYKMLNGEYRKKQFYLVLVLVLLLALIVAMVRYDWLLTL